MTLHYMILQYMKSVIICSYYVGDIQDCVSIEVIERLRLELILKYDLLAVASLTLLCN